MRFLILPGSNALSHLAKGLALRDVLLARGHEVAFAATPARSPFLARLGVPHYLLPDLQEADQGSAPAYAWFRQPERFIRVVRAERALMEEVRAQRVVGVFRFTATTSAALAGLPCDTLACGCMIPAFRGVLGFREEEPGAADQGAFLDTFFRGTARRASMALRALGRPDVADVRALLLGDRTFLWDTPGFQPLAVPAGVEHVGPLAWNGWPRTPGSIGPGAPLAILSMGTALPPGSGPARLVERLLALGYRVALAGGGHPDLDRPDPRVLATPFAPMDEWLRRAALLICHGGQQTLFEALARGVPAGVFPFHPEQAQNGLCLERLGAGARLIPPTVFWGSSEVYARALEAMDDAELDARILALGRLAARTPDPHLDRGAERLADRMVEP